MIKSLNFPTYSYNPTLMGGPTVFKCRATVATPPQTPTRKLISGGSLYEVLRVKPNASIVEIKSAYRNLAKVYHPDAAASSSGCDFIQIRNAYETLSDPAARAMYDMSIGFRLTESADRWRVGRRWETDQCW